MTAHTKPEIAVGIRWLIRRDMPAVLKIEEGVSDAPWTEEDILCCLRQRNCIGMVAEADGRVVGFMVYELHNARLTLLKIAVAWTDHRRSVGRQMIRRLIDKLSAQRRREIVADVRESDLAAQLFFKAVGFRAVGVTRDGFDDPCEDAYRMRYVLPLDDAEPVTPFNRVAGLADDLEAAGY